MIGHLGTRVSALLDGQLGPEETERAWAHVHVCHGCRDLVEREGWIKTRLSGLSADAVPGAPEGLKGLLKGDASGVPAPVPPAPWPVAPSRSADRPSRGALTLAAIGGGAAGAAVMGVLTLGAAPADAPTRQQPPTVSVRTPTQTDTVLFRRLTR